MCLVSGLDQLVREQQKDALLTMAPLESPSFVFTARHHLTTVTRYFVLGGMDGIAVGQDTLC